MTEEITKLHKRHYEQFADGTVKDIEDEIPFEVPEGWAWCRLGEISSELGDGIHGTPEYDVNGDYYFVNGNNLCNGKIIIKDDTKRVSQIEYNKYKKNLNQNTILVSINGTLGNIAFYNKENIILGKSACYFNLFEKQFKDFMFFLLSSEYFKKYASENATGSTIKNVSLKTMRDFLVPLPTLNEQKKIVSAIKTIFNQITIIENDKTDLQEIIKQTKSKILDLAIHGKLVPQDPNDEPAEELLKRIATSDNRPYEKVEEEPFEIPDSWRWVKLNDLAEIARGGSPRPIQDYITEDKDGINWIKIGDTSEKSKYITSSKEKIKPEGKKHSRYVHAGDFLLTNSMSFGRPYILKIDGCIHDGWLVFANIKECLLQDYLYYALSSAYIYETFSNVAAGSTVKNLKSDTVKQVDFPLPPLSEQKRIVEAIENMYEVLDQIQNNLV